MNQNSAGQNIVEIDNLSFGYKGRMLHQGINMVFPRGKVVAIMGGSGCGKTTLLRLIGGQVKPNKGEVRVDNQVVHKQTLAGIYELRRKMGMLFQHGALFTDLNVFENVAFPLREHTQLNETELFTQVLETLDAVGLKAAAHLKLSEISGGMARRVALARAVVRSPEHILYDEPFAGLDPISLGVTARLIRQLSDRLDCASVLITHDIAESFAIADAVYLVGQGTLKAQGSPASLSDSTDPYVRQFLDGAPDGPVAFDYPTTPAYERWLNHQVSRR